MKILRILFSASVFFVAGSVLAGESGSPSFVSDKNIQKIAETYALDAIQLAKTQLGISLDWTDDSIGEVEKAMTSIHTSYMTTSPRPTDEQVMLFATRYGSYVGEVYRRNHGAEWGMVTLGGQKFPGLQTKSGINFWPWARISNRIVDGAENNVLDYYKVLLKK
ncbi:hypothetical protein [Collimonas arenae]|nr:hypothetical protein [Collimonas arenae]